MKKLQTLDPLKEKINYESGYFTVPSQKGQGRVVGDPSGTVRVGRRVPSVGPEDPYRPSSRRFPGFGPTSPGYAVDWQGNCVLCFVTGAKTKVKSLDVF